MTVEGNDGVSATGKQYASDLFEAEALSFIKANQKRPFFLYFATTVPHLALQVPDDSLEEYRGRWDDPPYDGKNGYLPQKYPRAAYAAMVTRFDRSVGRMMSVLKEIGLDRTTLVLLTSDNGATFRVGGFDPDFFKDTVPFRDYKGAVYEGGIRVPLIGRWPGVIPPGRTSDHVCGLQDVLPTILEAADAGPMIPGGIDGVSFLPELAGRGRQASHPYLFMEFAGYGGQVFVRLGNWAAVRRDLIKNLDAPIELYDLSVDIGETKNIATGHPDIVKKVEGIIRAEHRPSKEFPLPALDRLR